MVFECIGVHVLNWESSGFSLFLIMSLLVLLFGLVCFIPHVHENSSPHNNLIQSVPVIEIERRHCFAGSQQNRQTWLLKRAENQRGFYPSIRPLSDPELLQCEQVARTGNLLGSDCVHKITRYWHICLLTGEKAPSYQSCCSSGKGTTQ